ncbi:MAG: hypothetical protein C0167_00970 [Nitrososphaera sp.]|nr:MAG: hypothetical protein C0167_00970 [Nitrososphaera sp.]
MDPIRATVGTAFAIGAAIIIYFLLWMYRSAMSYAAQPNPFYASWAIGMAFAQIAIILIMLFVVALAAALLAVR